MAKLCETRSGYDKQNTFMHYIWKAHTEHTTVGGVRSGTVPHLEKDLWSMVK